MILSKRVQRSQYHTSYPTSSEQAPSFSSCEPLASGLTTPPHGHKHSLSKPMTWLNRSSSSTSSRSVPHAASKPTRISEPKLGSTIEKAKFHRSGPLGSGATIVRTPQEALLGSSRAFELASEEEGVKGDLLHNTEKNETRVLPPPPSSPPLPPLPDISDAEAESRRSVSSAGILLSDHDVSHPRLSSSPPPAATHRSSSRPTLLDYSRAPRPIPVPTADPDLMPPQPPFEAILLSSIPDGTIDPSKLIITLETCTTTYRTLLRTLVSRPSHLSRFITSLLSPVSETASVYSNASGMSSTQHSNWFNSVFRDHLASSGFLPQSSSIHIFLDRPSAPYTQVLAYLRSLPGTPEHPETLPRAAQLGSTPPPRLECLLELRDEAYYLGLAELYKLCCREINRFHCSSPSIFTGGVLRGKSGSVHSFRTLVEQYQPHTEARMPDIQASRCKGDSRAMTRESSSSSSCENKEVLVRERGKQGKVINMMPPPSWI